MPPGSATFGGMQLLALLSALALLVCNAAAGLASRLARGLALTTTTVLSAVAQVASLNSLDMFHNFTFHFEIYGISLTHPTFYVNHIFHTFHTVSCIKTSINYHFIPLKSVFIISFVRMAKTAFLQPNRLLGYAATLSQSL